MTVMLNDPFLMMGMQENAGPENMLTPAGHDASAQNEQDFMQFLSQHSEALALLTEKQGAEDVELTTAVAEENGFDEEALMAFLLAQSGNETLKAFADVAREQLADMKPETVRETLWQMRSAIWAMPEQPVALRQAIQQVMGQLSGRAAVHGEDTGDMRLTEGKAASARALSVDSPSQVLPATAGVQSKGMQVAMNVRSSPLTEIKMSGDTLLTTAAASSQAIQTAGMSDGVNTSQAVAESQKAATLKLHAHSYEPVSQQLRAALGERLQLQMDSRVQHATIRLDPPDMGKIDITLNVDAGKLQVHINASQSEVYRALQQVSQDLKQALSEQNFVQVNVQVASQHSADRQGREMPQYRHEHEDDIQDAQRAETARRRNHTDDGSVLMTV